MKKFSKNSYDVIFFRRGKRRFFMYKGNEFDMNNIYELKLLLKLPFIVKFYGFSRAQIGGTLRILLNEEMDCKIYKVKKENSNVLEFAVTFFEKKNENVKTKRLI